MGQTNFEGIGIKQQGSAAETLFNTVLNGSATIDPASIAAGATATTSITVTGAAVGNFVMVAPGVDMQGLLYSGYVSAADTVEVAIYNPTAGAVDLASSTWKAKVFT